MAKPSNPYLMPVPPRFLDKNYSARLVYRNQRDEYRPARNAYACAKLAYQYHQLDWQDGRGADYGVTYAKYTATNGHTVTLNISPDNEWTDYDYQGEFSNSWGPGAVNSSELQGRMRDCSHMRRVRGLGMVRVPRRLQQRKNRNHSYESWGLYRLDTGRYWIPEKYSTVDAIAPYYRGMYGRHGAYLKAIEQVRECEQLAVDGVAGYTLSVTIKDKDGNVLAEENTYYTVSMNEASFYLIDPFNDLLHQAFANIQEAEEKARNAIYAHQGVVVVPLPL